MKKRSFAFFLAFCWVIGMVAIFSFPPKIKTAEEKTSHDTFLNELASPELHIRTSFENLKVPPFEIDWRLGFKFNTEWFPGFVQVGVRYLPPSYFQKSRSLLDTRLFFIRFFYSW